MEVVSLQTEGTGSLTRLLLPEVHRQPRASPCALEMGIVFAASGDHSPLSNGYKS